MADPNPTNPMATQEPRTWLLYWNNGEIRIKGPELVTGEFGAGCRVVEAQPLVELLEAMVDRQNLTTQDSMELTALLTTLRGPNA